MRDETRRTLETFMKNPSIVGRSEKYKQIIEKNKLYQKFNKYMHDRAALPYTVYKDTRDDVWYYHFNIESESDSEVIYDVVIEFSPDNKELSNETTLKNYLIRLFSNSPGFSFTYAYAYAHYKIGGVWTVSPGVAMEKVSAGYWKLSIDLGNASEAAICFNDGNGTWDNNSKKNYTVYAGSYLVAQTTKQVTVMATQSPIGTNEPTATPTPSYKVIKISDYVPKELRGTGFGLYSLMVGASDSIIPFKATPTP